MSSRQLQGFAFYFVMGVGWGGPGMWGVRKLPFIGVQRPVCRALVSAPRAGKREHPWGPEQRASDHPAEARGSPHGGVLLWMERGFQLEERMKDSELTSRGVGAMGRGTWRTLGRWGSFRDGVEVAI